MNFPWWRCAVMDETLAKRTVEALRAVQRWDVVSPREDVGVGRGKSTGRHSGHTTETEVQVADVLEQLLSGPLLQPYLLTYKGQTQASIAAC